MTEPPPIPDQIAAARTVLAAALHTARGEDQDALALLPSITPPAAVAAVLGIAAATTPDPEHTLAALVAATTRWEATPQEGHQP